MDYRRAVLAVELFNQGDKGFDALSKRPDLMDVLLQMGRAQADSSSVTLDDVYRDLNAQKPPEEE